MPINKNQIPLNRNQLIGTAIGKGLGYMVQGKICSEIAAAINPYVGPIGTIAVKATISGSIKVVKYTCKAYGRGDFGAEILFSDAIDASFNAF